MILPRCPPGGTERAPLGNRHGAVRAEQPVDPRANLRLGRSESAAAEYANEKDGHAGQTRAHSGLTSGFIRITWPSCGDRLPADFSDRVQNIR